jgi:Tfp pilus assembly protein FimV
VEDRFIEMIVAAAVGASVLAAWWTLRRRAKSPGEVDALAEAEVYLAYGRRKEAVEILKEALETGPERRKEIEAKLRELQGSPSPVTKL